MDSGWETTREFGASTPTHGMAGPAPMTDVGNPLT